MLTFLKKLFSFEDKEVTVVLLDEGQAPASSHRISTVRMWLLVAAAAIVGGILLFIIVMVTPLGNYVYNPHERAIRQSVIAVQQKVAALEDSVKARNMQLQEIQHVMLDAKDTTFNVSNGKAAEAQFLNYFSTSPFSNARSVGNLPSSEILFAKIFKQTPEFPAPYPLKGILTRGFNRQDGHLGVDIAANENAPFRAIADGAVIGVYWTMNYGYVMQIQHSGGFITVYKHVKTPDKSVGDIVMKGDIVGTIGNMGVLSSGPHLHIEIWRNGVPQNPLNYLVNP